jgi:hypothetical protein
MWKWIVALDRLLRGESTSLPALREAELRMPLVGFMVLIELLGMIYGVCMGTFSLTPGGSGHAMQLLATTVKVPALFVLTLLVTFPSLYVFSALVGSQLLILAVLRVLIAALAVMLATLASIGPIVCFFSFTTTSYPFMIVLNVFVFSVAGLLGLLFLLQTLHRLSVVTSQASVAGPDEPVGRQVKSLFRIWVLVFGLVGAQMAWVLRPFIGHPGEVFTWFRHPGSNFFVAVAHALGELFS